MTAKTEPTGLAGTRGQQTEKPLPANSPTLRGVCQPRDELLDAALAYARRGWQVFPCAARGKVPAIPKEQGGHGVLDATCDETIIRDWWSRMPRANIGLAAGASALVIIDIDTHGVDGWASWRELKQWHTFTDDTLQSATPTGGAHFLYAAPPGVELHNSEGKLGPGLDVRANGGYIVAPPSIHPSGGVYQWASAYEIDPAPLPAVLVELLRKPERPAARLLPVVHSPDGDYERARSALARLAPFRCDVRQDWVNVGMALSELGNDGLALWESWSQGSQKFKAGECAKLWQGFNGDGLTLGSLFHWADVDSPRPALATARHDLQEPQLWLPDDELGAALHHASSVGPATAPALKVLSCRELLTTAWQDPPWVVPGLLPVGLTLLAGRAKLGKSWLALQLTQAVATGGSFLGKQVERGACLYLALEDPPRRLAGRMKSQGWSDLDAQADFVTVGSLRAGGGEALAASIRDRGYRLVIVDTLSRALAGDQNDGQAMTAALTPLQEAAHTAGCAVVMVDHHNKVGAATTGAADGVLEPDPIVNVLGATAKAAMADCILGMYRQSGKRGALLVGLGRDVEKYQLDLEQDHTTHCWQVVNEAGVPLGSGQAEVLNALKGLGWATCTEVAAAVGKERGNVYGQLQGLVTLGLAFRDEKHYAPAGSAEELAG